MTRWVINISPMFIEYLHFEIENVETRTSRPLPDFHGNLRSIFVIALSVLHSKSFRLTIKSAIYRRICYKTVLCAKLCRNVSQSDWWETIELNYVKKCLQKNTESCINICLLLFRKILICIVVVVMFGIILLTYTIFAKIPLFKML